MKNLVIKLSDELADYYYNEDLRSATLKYSSDSTFKGYPQHSISESYSEKIASLTSGQIKEVLEIVKELRVRLPYKYNIAAYNKLTQLCNRELNIRAKNLSKDNGVTV